MQSRVVEDGLGGVDDVEGSRSRLGVGRLAASGRQNCKVGLTDWGTNDKRPVDAGALPKSKVSRVCT